MLARGLLFPAAMKSLLGLVATSTTLLAFACGGQLDDRSYGASPLASAESK